MSEEEFLKVLNYLTDEKQKYLAWRNDCARDRNRLIFEGKEDTFELYETDQRIAKYDGKIELLIKLIDKINTEI